MISVIDRTNSWALIFVVRGWCFFHVTWRLIFVLQSEKGELCIFARLLRRMEQCSLHRHDGTMKRALVSLSFGADAQRARD